MRVYVVRMSICACARVRVCACARVCVCAKRGHAMIIRPQLAEGGLQRAGDQHLQLRAEHPAPAAGAPGLHTCTRVCAVPYVRTCVCMRARVFAWQQKSNSVEIRTDCNASGASICSTVEVGPASLALPALLSRLSLVSALSALSGASDSWSA